MGRNAGSEGPILRQTPPYTGRQTFEGSILLNRIGGNFLAGGPSAKSFIFGSSSGAGTHLGGFESFTEQQRSRRFGVYTASTIFQQKSAQHLVGKRYASRGYGYTAPVQIQGDNQLTLTAGDGTEVLGTLTVRFDSPEGLQADEVFGLEIQALRKAGRRVCEFTKLAVEEDLPSQDILAALFHMAYIHAHHLRGFEVLAVEVNPRHVPYYRRMLGFKVCSPERTNLRVNAPAVLLCVEFEHIRAQIEALGGRPELAATVRNLYPYAFSPEEEAQLVQRLKRSLS